MNSKIIAVAVLYAGCSCPPEQSPNVAQDYADQLTDVTASYAYVSGKPAPVITLDELYIQRVPIEDVRLDCDPQAMGCTCNSFMCSDLITIPDTPVPIEDASGKRIGQYSLVEIATHELTHAVINATGCDSHDHKCNFWDVYKHAIQMQGLKFKM